MYSRCVGDFRKTDFWFFYFEIGLGGHCDVGSFDALNFRFEFARLVPDRLLEFVWFHFLTLLLWLFLQLHLNC